MYNVNDIVWLKKDCKDIEEYLLNHRLVIVGKNGEDNIAISDDYMTFVLCREEPKLGIHKGNKFFDETKGKMRFNRVFNNKYLYNEPIYANNINNLQQTTYANCKQPIYISDDMIDHKDGEVTSNQTKEFLRLYSTGKPNIDMVESINTLNKRYNLNESISYSSVFETYKNNILFKFAVIDESGVELDPFEEETNGIMGTIYIHTQKEDDYIEFWWDFDENIIGIGGTDDLMLDYNLSSGDVDLLSCKYSEEFVNTLLDAVDEFVNN